jgi:hypothetical protein
MSVAEHLLRTSARSFAERALVLLGYDLVKTAGKSPLLIGRLYRSRTGFGLLTVPNALGIGIFKSLREPGLELPISESFKRYNAHITVFHPDEINEIEASGRKISEWNHEFEYRPTILKVFEPKGWEGVSRCWVQQVASPDLQTLRKTYGLTPLPKGDHEFHITVGIRKKHVLFDNEVSKAAGDLLEAMAKDLKDAPEERRRWLAKEAAVFITNKNKSYAGPDLDAQDWDAAERKAKELGLELVGELVTQFRLPSMNLVQ